MKWIKYTLKTFAEAEDIVVSALTDAGVCGAEIIDNTPLTGEELEGMFVDIPLPAGEDDGMATISFYLEPDADQEEILRRVEEELDALRQFMDIGDCGIEVSETEDKDWVNNWKEFFHSFRIDDIFVVPSWEEAAPLPTDRIVLRIDPGTAFGTGLHETTQLCIRQLKKYLRPQDRLLDLGTGSGILSIISVKLGAACALGTDLDPCTVDAVAQNKASNGMKDDQFRLLIGNIIDDEEIQKECGTGYDVITANILADVLIPLAPVAIRHLKPGGIFITSGIIDFKEEEVTKAFEAAGFMIEEVNHQGEWVAVTAKRPEEYKRPFSHACCDEEEKTGDSDE